MKFGETTIRIICLADTHSLHEKLKIPHGDILIHAGDFCGHGSPSEVIRFDAWLGTLPHLHKIVIAGTHDWPFERDPAARALLTNATYLQDSEVTVMGLRIYGSPWQPAFFNWAFNLARGEEIRRKWDMIPEGIDILVTHGPPFGVADKVEDGSNVGCADLLRAIERVRPKIHVCGHIHSGYGSHEIQRLSVKVINASNCDEQYRAVNPPIVVELKVNLEREH
ncbi:metallophosphatase domain-containing protein [Bdellovibrionota bacterium FG-2]